MPVALTAECYAVPFLAEVPFFLYAVFGSVVLQFLPMLVLAVVWRDPEVHTISWGLDTHPVQLVLVLGILGMGIAYPIVCFRAWGMIVGCIWVSVFTATLAVVQGRKYVEYVRVIKGGREKEYRVVGELPPPKTVAELVKKQQRYAGVMLTALVKAIRGKGGWDDELDKALDHWHFFFAICVFTTLVAYGGYAAIDQGGAAIVFGWGVSVGCFVLMIGSKIFFGRWSTLTTALEHLLVQSVFLTLVQVRSVP